MSAAMPRLIAFNLPQFHPTPENDAWWGKGFTEWTNVTKARPVFRGHYQPHLPADLGFYDLRLPEAREQQASLAREYGIGGFCYYHYWFGGKRLLNRPVDEILASKTPDFPFCLCWANQTWSRTWLGEERDILIEQTYSDEDDRAHALWLSSVFRDERYIRVDGRPVFLFYNVPHHPEPQRFCRYLKEETIRACGVEPYLVGTDSHCPFVDTRTYGLDTTLHFEPQLSSLPECFSDRWSLERLKRNAKHNIFSGTMKVYDYAEARALMNLVPMDFPYVPCVLVGWDNTPRRGARGSVLINSSPAAFENELTSALLQWKKTPRQDDLVFLNGWNEWAEGNHLEPDSRFGLGYLEAVRNALVNTGSIDPPNAKIKDSPV